MQHHNTSPVGMFPLFMCFAVNRAVIVQQEACQTAWGAASSGLRLDSYCITLLQKALLHPLSCLHELLTSSLLSVTMNVTSLASALFLICLGVL